MAESRPAVSLINVHTVAVDDLVNFIYPITPIPRTENIELLAALMVQSANDYNIYSSMHAKMVAQKAVSERSSEINAKVDILYRALRCAELNYQALSRILTAVQSKNPASRWSGFIGDDK